jgi:hypothetical protein
MDKSLRLQVIFGALEKVSAPVQRMRAGTKGLAKDMAATRKEITALRAAQNQISQVGKLRSGLGDTQSDLVKLRLRMQQLRTEIGRTDNPTKELTQALSAAEREEKKLIATSERQSAALAKLQRELTEAGVDTTDLSRHQAELARRMAAANGRLGEQQDRLTRVNRAKERGEKIKSVGRGVMTAGAVSTAAISAPLIAFGARAMTAAKESREADAQVENSLANMKNNSGRTFAALKAQSEQLQSTSLFDDDDIMRDVTASILMFGKVSGPIFDRAQQTAVDLAAKLKKDPKAAALMLGKALQDPVKGLGALGKAGVTFDAAEKKRLATLVKTNQLTKAQEIILGRLASVRGAAAADRAAHPEAAAAQDLRTLEESVGANLQTNMKPVLEQVGKLLAAFNSLSPHTQGLIVKIAILAAVFGPVVVALGGLITVIGVLVPIFSALAGAVGLTMLPLLAVIAAVALLAFAGYEIYQHWGPIKAWFIGLWESIKGAFSAVVGWFGQMFQRLGAFFRDNFQTILMVVAPFLAIPLMIYSNWGAISGWFAGLWGRVKGIFAAAPGAIWQAFKNGFLAGFAWLVGLNVQFAQIGANLISGLIRGFLGGLGRLKDTIVGAAGKVKDWFAKKLGIHSPSRVFMGFGGFLTEGLALGVDRGAAEPIDRIRRLARNMGSAMALGAAAPALAMPTASSATIGTVAAAAARGPAVAAAGAGAGSVYNITINQLPGQDPQELALMVRRAIEAHEREKAAAAASRYEDD